jgi:hypothetical protein
MPQNSNASKRFVPFSMRAAADLLLDALVAFFKEGHRLKRFYTPGTIHNDALLVIQSLGLTRTSTLDSSMAFRMLVFIRDELRRHRGSMLDAQRKFERTLKAVTRSCSDQQLADWAAHSTRIFTLFTGDREMIEPAFIQHQTHVFRTLLEWCFVRARGSAVP